MESKFDKHRLTYMGEIKNLIMNADNLLSEFETSELRTLLFTLRRKLRKRELNNQSNGKQS